MTTWLLRGHSHLDPVYRHRTQRSDNTVVQASSRFTSSLLPETSSFRPLFFAISGGYLFLLLFRRSAVGGTLIASYVNRRNFIKPTRGTGSIQEGEETDMKYVIGITVLCGTVWLSGYAGLFAGEETQAKYCQCIEDRTKRCMKKASRVNSESAAIRAGAERAREEADYLRGSKDQLASEMADAKTGTRRHQVDHFLVGSFRAHLLESAAPGAQKGH